MMPKGSIVNAVAVIAGTMLGILIKGKLSEKFKTTIMQALGLAVIIIGLSGTLSAIFKVASNGTLENNNIMTMIIFLVLKLYNR